MHFGNPQFLWLLLLWPVLAWLGWLALRWRNRVLERIGQPPLVTRLYPDSVGRWRRRQLLMALVAVGLVMIAAARPQYGKIEQTIRSIGANVIIALDCSNSMKAKDIQPTPQDMQPSRMKAAKQSLELLLR